MVIQEEMSIKICNKTEAEKGGGVWQMLTWLTKGVGEVLTLADKGGSGGMDPPPFFADIICEQPIRVNSSV